MRTELVDNEWLAIGKPEGFEGIEHAELETLMGLEYDCMWGMRDERRHMLVSVSWKDSNALLTKMVGEKSLAKRVDDSFGKRYRKGGYRCNGRFERTVAGASAPAQGFRFSYTIQGVAQEGEVLVFKRGTRCYTLYYYTRLAVARDNHPVYEGILDSIQVR